MCPPSLSLSLPLPSSPSQADKQQEDQREIRVDIIAVGEEQEEQPAKPTKAPKKAGATKSTPAGGKNIVREGQLQNCITLSSHQKSLEQQQLPWSLAAHCQTAASSSSGSGSLGEQSKAGGIKFISGRVVQQTGCQFFSMLGTLVLVFIAMGEKGHAGKGREGKLVFH